MWAGADIFICLPDGNCSDEDSADEADLQLHNLSRRQLLAQCELSDNELIDFIVQMTNAYAIDTNVVGGVHIDRNDICCFLRILLLSGFVQLPSYKLFWEEASDVQQQVTWPAMPQNKFYLILKSIHFCDNGNLDPADKCSKVRPFMNIIQERCKKFAKMRKSVNVNEPMIPYYGKFGQKLKQRMPLKPIRSGYKVRCLNLQVL